MAEKSVAQLSSAEQTATNADVHVIRKQFPDRIQVLALLGSKARGDDAPESGIGLLVICDTEDRPSRSDWWRKASEISLEQCIRVLDLPV